MPLPAARYSAESVYLVFIQEYISRIQYNEDVLVQARTPSTDLVRHLMAENTRCLAAIETLRQQMMAANGLVDGPNGVAVAVSEPDPTPVPVRRISVWTRIVYALGCCGGCAPPLPPLSPLPPIPQQQHSPTPEPGSGSGSRSASSGSTPPSSSSVQRTPLALPLPRAVHSTPSRTETGERLVRTLASQGVDVMAQPVHPLSLLEPPPQMRQAMVLMRPAGLSEELEVGASTRWPPQVEA